MRALLLALLAAAPAALGALPAPEPWPGTQAEPGPAMFLRTDPDGNRTLLVELEDDPAGPVMHRFLVRISGREVGTYLHPWTWNGLPEVTLGVYVGTTCTAAGCAAGTVVRRPLVVLEHAPSDGALLNAFLDAALGYGLGVAARSAQLLGESLLPELFVDPAEDFSDHLDHPTVVAWHARRAVPGAEAWLGTYAARDASVQSAGGTTTGVRSAELGVVARVGTEDTRLAGVYLEETAAVADGPGQRAYAASLTAGARSPEGRAPLLAMRGEDAREGPLLADAQATSWTLGLAADGGFTPLLGVRSDVDYRPHAAGTEVTRTTALGAYPGGSWTPLAGLRTHDERSTTLGDAIGFLNGGTLGSGLVGDAEVSAGAFVDGAYAPLVQATLDDGFPGQQFGRATMVGVGPVTPLGYRPLASLTYDGTHSLLDWAFRARAGEEQGSAWLVSAGPWAGSLYAPLVGVRYSGLGVPGAPARTSEVAVGTFALGYANFVPLLAAHVGSEQPLGLAAGGQVFEGPGHQGGAWSAGAGTYALGPRQALVEVRYAPVDDPANPASSDTVVALGGAPALGVRYRGAAPLLPALGAPLDLTDDAAWTAAVGLYPAGSFLPLLRVAHDGQGTGVVVGPDLGVGA